eukprot:gene31718-biopygen6571
MEINILRIMSWQWKQQQHAGGSLEGGSNAGEPSGSGNAGLAGDEVQIIPPSGGDKNPSGSGTATAIAPDMLRDPTVKESHAADDSGPIPPLVALLSSGTAANFNANKLGIAQEQLQTAASCHDRLQREI